MKYKKLIFIIILIFAVLVTGLFIFFNINKTESFKPGPTLNGYLQIGFSDEVEKILSSNIELLKELVKDSTIIAEVKKSNEKAKNISWEEINRLDKEWQEVEKTNEFIRSFMTNSTAKVLIEFQKINPDFPEIFITNNRGLNVGQTNKTSDYLQADEAWWVNSYNDGKGKAFHGNIEFDQSALAESIALYIPIMDTQSQQAIGVLKAILDIKAIKSEL